ncbi:MAG: universal stress protein [Myxococcales bacterium]|nr:universal stress protein [Myxococcales bacterium]
MFKHLLLATDFSKAALLATGAARDIAHQLGAKITLVNVLGPKDGQTAAERMRYLEVVRDDRLSGVETELAVLEHASPSVAIAEHVAKVGADLVVAGRHGEHSLAEKLIGSTTERLARQVSSSVFVAHPAKRDPLSLARHILVGTDFSDESEPALKVAASLARAFESKVTLMHVYDIVPPVDMLDIPESDDSHVTGVLDARLAALAEEHFGGLMVDLKLIRDKSTVTAMCDWAGDHHVDITVLGTHGFTGVKRLLLGSIAERVIRHSPSSVLVVR